MSTLVVELKSGKHIGLVDKFIQLKKAHNKKDGLPKEQVLDVKEIYRHLQEEIMKQKN